MRAACTSACRWRRWRKMNIISLRVRSVKATGRLLCWVVWIWSLLDDISSRLADKTQWSLLRASVRRADGPRISGGVYDDWADMSTHRHTHAHRAWHIRAFKPVTCTWSWDADGYSHLRRSGVKPWERIKQCTYCTISSQGVCWHCADVLLGNTWQCFLVEQVS